MPGYTGSHEPRLFVQYLLCCLSARRIFVISLRIPSKHVNRATIGPQAKRHSNGVSLKRRFAGWPIVARDWILAGHIIWRGRPLNSFAVSRAANSISPDQTEPTMFAKNISKMFQQKTKLVISVFSALGILFISTMKCFL